MTVNFRSKVRTWLATNCPPSMRQPATEEAIVGGGRRQRFDNEEAKDWLVAMAAKGWTAPTWPAEYGGGGLTAPENSVLQDELMHINARAPITGMGFSMIGPTLLDFGTEAQKQEHLPKIVSGEVRWCQGYSEPGAGSDLANVQTRCSDEGDHFLINGQKTWTSGAQYADWIFALVRTDFQALKHDGISFVLIDMDQPGVLVKPIQLISGQSPFCETFFDQVRCDKRNLVGQRNRGWSVGKRLLQHERSSISGLAGAGRRGRYDHFGSLKELYQARVGARRAADADGSLKARVLANTMNQRAFALTQRRSFEESQSGGTPTFLTSLFKYYGSENGSERMELQLELMGHLALGWAGDSFSDLEQTTTRTWLRSKASTIAGGSSEVQLNIIAKRVLGLPDG